MPLELIVDRERARFGELVRALPALLGRLRGRRASSCRGSPSSASTSSTCRRSTRSAAPTARGGTTRSTAAPGDPGSPWAIGGPEGGHTAINPELGTIADFDRLVAPRARSSASRSRSTSRSSARPTTPGSTSTRSGSTAAPTARSSTPRTRPSATRTSTTSTSSRRTGRASGRRCATSCSSGSGTACRSSASTTRTRSRSPFWEWLIREVAGRATPRSIFLSEAFTRPALMSTLAKAGLQPVLHVLHLEEHEGASWSSS